MTRFKILLLVMFCLIFFIFPKVTLAGAGNQFITIVNPVRISSYTIDPVKSLQAQYNIINKNQLPATWLLTFDVINSSEAVSTTKAMNEKQEFGIFFEVSPTFAKNAGVEYNDTGFWHHATSVFLSGYTQDERRKLIDTVFETFKEVFGYYPASVGSWWTDSFSLNYMQEKYGITGNLGVADQFSTDGYQIWGTFWSTPYYPSRYHAGIPAPSEEAKLDVVMFQWAPRDPLNGYKNSLFSTQDYFRKEVGQGVEYFETLVNLYAKSNTNQFGQITVGLEGDFNPSDYAGHFSRQMEVVRKLANSGDFTATNMKEFSNWYRNKFGNISPDHIVETDDLLGEKIKVHWYQSPRYRIGIKHNYEDNSTIIFDFRSYHEDMQEPFYQSPNKEFDLSINIFSYFDELNYTSDVWELDLGKLEKTDGPTMSFANGEIRFSKDGITLIGLSRSVPNVLVNSPTLTINNFGQRTDIVINESWLVGLSGTTYEALTPEATHLIKTRKVKLAVYGIVVLYFAGAIILIRADRRKRFKLIVPLVVLGALVLGANLWSKKNSTIYLVPQGEIEVLNRLSSLPEGQVLVYDNECLQCEYHTELKPAIFANKRGYVEKWSKKNIVYNSNVFEAETREQAKSEFDETKVEYVYLVKFEDYIESLPFSPGDLGVEKLYANANAELWKIK